MVNGETEAGDGQELCLLEPQQSLLRAKALEGSFLYWKDCPQQVLLMCSPPGAHSENTASQTHPRLTKGEVKTEPSMLCDFREGIFLLSFLCRRMWGRCPD